MLDQIWSDQGTQATSIEKKGAEAPKEIGRQLSFRWP